MRKPLQPFDYTARDFDSIKRFFIDWIRERYPDEFTDFTESQLGIMIAELWAGIGEILSYNLDRAANELFITTARQRRSLVRHAALVGYKPSAATSASCDLFLQTDILLNYTSDITIAPQVIYAGDIAFQITDTYTISRKTASFGTGWSVNGGVTNPNPQISAAEGQPATLNVYATGGPFQAYEMQRGPIIDGTMRVVIGNAEWTEVDSLIYGDPDDPSNTNIYELELDGDDIPTVRFGSYISGSSPTEGSIIAFSYRIGGGSVGNIAEGTLLGPVRATVDGNSIQIPVYNTQATGGTDRESDDRIRQFAPQWGRTTDRAVTLTDYIVLCSGFSDPQYGYVAKAGVIADPTDGLSNVVTPYVWAEDEKRNLVSCSQALKDSLRAFLERRRTLAVFINEVQDGENVTLNVDLSYRRVEAYPKAGLEAAITRSVKEYFLSPTVRIHGDIRISDLFSVIINVPGVDWCHVEAIRTGTGDDLPRNVTGDVEDIESDVLYSTQPSEVNVVRIPVGSSRVADYYANYHIVIGSQDRRIIQSTADNSGTVDLTIEEEFDPGVTAGQAFTITHPRRIKLGASTQDPNLSTRPLVNRVLVIPEVLSSGASRIRSIVAYDSTSGVAIVDKDWPKGTYPDSTMEYTVTRDYRAIPSRAFVIGSVNLTEVR